jgi:hypothetical protein
MEAYNLETLTILDHVQFARANMIAAYHNADATRPSTQHRKRDLGNMRRKGLLYCPEQQKMTANYRYSPRIYAVGPFGKKMLVQNSVDPSDKIDLKNFWHQLMISDIVLSLAIACKQKKLKFRFQKDLIGDAPLTFASNIVYDFPKGLRTCVRNCEPDYLFAIENIHFCLEADRGTETIFPSNFDNKSHLRSILQYRSVLKSGVYKELIPNMMVLNVTVADEHALNIMTMMLSEAKLSSSALLFTAADILGSFDNYPEPLTHLLDKPLARVGHPDFVINNEVNNGRAH